MDTVAGVTEKVENIKVGHIPIAMLSIYWHDIERPVHSNSFEQKNWGKKQKGITRTGKSQPITHQRPFKAEGASRFKQKRQKNSKKFRSGMAICVENGALYAPSRHKQTIQLRSPHKVDLCTEWKGWHGMVQPCQ